MRISNTVLPVIRLVALAVVCVGSVGVFALLWAGGGGSLPFLTADPYRVSLEVEEVNNLVDGSAVSNAGVPIGKVADIVPQGDKARVALEIDPEYAPLHEGVTARLREQTLVGETYVDFTDGDGDELAEGALIPGSEVTPVVQLDDVLRTLDKPTRKALSGALRSLGEGTDNTSAAVSDALSGAGSLSREGKTALSALAEQTTSLEQLSANTARALGALDTRNGQIAQLVTDAERLTRSTSAGSDEIKQVMRGLPGLLGAAREASGSVSELAPALRPVAANLEKAAPALNEALRQLPSTAEDLRALLPDLDKTLDKGPATLDRVPAVARDLRAMLPRAGRVLDTLNPMLAYVKPYGRDIVPFFTNFGLAVSRGDGNGSHLRVMPVFNEQSLKNHPLSTNDILDRNDAFPAPGGQSKYVNRSPLGGG